MFENLTEKLQRSFKNLRGQGSLTEKHVEEGLREIRLALLEADVNFKVVKQLVANIRKKALGREVLTALSPAEQILKIVRDELVGLLGTKQARLKRKSPPPTVYFMVGLQGSGKTTSSGKLALWLSKQGRKPLLVSVDVHRPAAREQLAIVAGQIAQPIYRGAETESSPVNLALGALREAKQTGRDIVLVDTAGRLHTRADLMAELGKIRRVAGRAVAGAPHEVLLVLDATVGQNGLVQARQFLDTAGVTGVVLTKLDGTAKGGVAVAIAGELGVPIRYVGVGEALEDLLPFSAVDYVDALFGAGDAP